MSRERSRRREERERLAAEAAATRVAAAAKQTRREARTAALTGWIPKPAPRQAGIIAERRRRQVAMTVAFVIAINVLVYFFSDDWSLRALVLVASLLGAPVFYTLMFRKS